MNRPQRQDSREILAIKVHQWLEQWDSIAFDESEHRRTPESHFYLFTLSATDLKALTGVHQRTTEDGQLRSRDLGIQRRHDKKRSDDISEFIHYGVPYAELTEARRQSGKFEDLRKPGWLPTAIVVNILNPGEPRRGRTVADEDVITIESDNERTAVIKLPKTFTGANWEPTEIHPIEVIDGQHRLWAFEDVTIEGKFELPVVAFHGLDVSWQAYLFWTINIKPKRINASLAFDLYPLLRTEEWLEKPEGLAVYRETRAQELTESLWAHPKSPWYHRINMLGESGLKKPMVSQAAWIRSLMSTYVKSWKSRRVHVGGLFGSKLGGEVEVLPWDRMQQAAFLIFMGTKVRTAIKNCKEPWADAVRLAQQHNMFEEDLDPAFSGAYTLLTTDQGIRGLLSVTNDLCYVRAQQLALLEWFIAESSEEYSEYSEEAISEALNTLENQPVSKFLEEISECLAKYDWRTSSAPGLTSDEATLKAAFRGSGGYKELRRQLLQHLMSESSSVGTAAEEVWNFLGYS